MRSNVTFICAFVAHVTLRVAVTALDPGVQLAQAGIKPAPPQPVLPPLSQMRLTVPAPNAPPVPVPPPPSVGRAKVHQASGAAA
jgi:hypothetical protein